MLRSEECVDLDSLKEKKRYQAENFLSGPWLLAVAAASLALSLSGLLLHVHVSQGQEPSPASLDAALRELPLLKANLTAKRTPKSVLPTGKANSTISGEEFAKCNTALAPSELSDTAPSSALTGMDCGEVEARVIAAALHAAGYSFEAISSKPAIFPSFLQQALWMLEIDTGHLSKALKHIQQNAATGELGTLVKFFAWGLPVPIADLETAMGIVGMDALQGCQLLAPCSKLPGMTTSAVMIFPVPQTSLLVATDWASKSRDGMTEDVVPVVTPEAMGLVYNSPSPRGLNVLDLESGHGLHAMVAALRGAKSSTIFVRSMRALHFAEFSVRMNELGNAQTEGSVTVLQARTHNKNLKESFDLALAAWNGREHAQKVGNFDLVLAQPIFLPVPDTHAAARQPQNGGKEGSKNLVDVFQVASEVLKVDGTFALVSDFPYPGFLEPLGCGKDGAPNFQGSLVVRKMPTSLEAFAAAHRAVADTQVQVSNMRQHMSAVTSGFFFGKRQSFPEAYGGCGYGLVKTEYMGDPYAQPQAGESNLGMACSLSRQSGCPEGLGTG
jgi:hypothetical protein